MGRFGFLSKSSLKCKFYSNYISVILPNKFIMDFYNGFLNK